VNREHQIVIDVQTSADKIDQWVEELMSPCGADLEIEGENETESSLCYPVVLVEAEPEQRLLLDISSAGPLWHTLEADTRVRLSGKRRHTKILSSPLEVGQSFLRAGKTFCYVSYPEEFQVSVRRNAFRAPLRKGMTTLIVLRRENPKTQLCGHLKDLSVTGCQVQLPVKAANVMAANLATMALEITFPNGMTLELMGDPRHHHIDVESGVISAGFEFQGLTAQQSRTLWYCVREIEREYARGAGDGRELKPSPLFVGKAGEKAPDYLNHSHYATPMARLLAHTADYISTQILSLKTGEDIDAVTLSRQADNLLSLLSRDREGVLFALGCISDQPELVRHCLAVAVRLTDIANFLHMPREATKAVAACGMIHDLGKVLSSDIAASSGESTRAAADHVDLLLDKLTHCRWLSREVVREVIGQINERNDGSGYPQGLKRNELSELGRLAAVVDMAESLRMGLPGSGPSPTMQVQRILLDHTDQFDEKWVRFYFRHFGRIPVGSLVRFVSGQYGWVSTINAEGGIASVYSATGPAAITTENLGPELTGKALHIHGEAQEVVHL